MFGGELSVVFDVADDGTEEGIPVDVGGLVIPACLTGVAVFVCFGGIGVAL